MLAKIHNRGTSFKGVSDYLLNDVRQERHPGQPPLEQEQTANRVSWVASFNLGEDDPAQAWRAMYDTWNDRTRLKRESGADLCIGAIG